MRPVRDLWSELVERRLWPIPLVLLAALVAVPLLLAKPASKSGGDDAAATAAPPAAVAAAAGLHTPEGPVVSVSEQSSTGGAPLRGHEKNPFRQQHVPPKPKVAGAAVDTGSAPSTGPTTPPTSGGDNGGAGTEPQPPQKTYELVSIDVRFGTAAGPKRKIADVPRLTPLPNAAKPVVVFLGMRRDRETAVFLVSTDVHAQGDGRCVPSKKVCQAVELRQGQVAFLDVSGDDGSVTQYELDLDRVSVHETTSKAEAQSAYARTSRAGSRVLRKRARSSAVNTGAARRPQRIPFRYAAGSGVLHIAPYLSQRLAHGAAVHGARGAVRQERAVADPRRAATP